LKSKYLEVLKNFNVTPNFYCSQEYFEKAKLKEVVIDDLIFWEEDDWIICPPINIYTGELFSGIFTPDQSRYLSHMSGKKRVWSSFQDWHLPDTWKEEFLDYEYFYRPKDFTRLEGGRWQVFRKNIRKFPGRYGKAPLDYTYVEYIEDKKGEEFVTDQLEILFLDWLEMQGREEKIEDDEVIMSYLYEGNLRKVLFDKDFTILGINIWDFNHSFINFRFSFNRGHKFLSEYIRYLFYTDSEILNQNKLVNDGGILGDKNIQAFKEKLNPAHRTKLFSYTKTEGKDEKDGVVIGN